MRIKENIRLASLLLLGTIVQCLSMAVYGQLSINAISTAHTISFDATLAGVNNGQITGAGFRPIPSAGRMDSDAWAITGFSNGDLAFGGTQTTANTDYTRGTHTGTGTSAGGVYAFGGGSIGGRAMGVQPSSSDFTSGTVILRVFNNTGGVIDQFDIQYELHVRNDQPRGNSFTFSHSADNVSFKSEPSLDYTSAAASTGNAFFLAGMMNVSLRCINLQPGDFYYLRWSGADASGSGARDEFALDNIQVTAVPFSQPVYYSRNSGNQTTNVGTSTQLWATTSAGVGAVQWPLDRCANYVVQNGDIVTLTGSSNGLTINDLEVEPTGQLLSNTAPATPRYLNIRGDILCDGQIGVGTGNIVGNGISFNIENGAQTISGAGSFDCSRMRKSSINLTNGVTDLSIDMDLVCNYAAVGMYNNCSGTSSFNVTIEAGVAVDVARFSFDGLNYTGSRDAGGSLLIHGTMNVSVLMYLYSDDNPSSSTSTMISSTGRLNTEAIYFGASSAPGGSFTIDPGGYLDMIGAGAWTSFSLTNNTFTFSPLSTVEYSAAAGQTVRSSPSYGNIIFSSLGNKTLNGGDLTVVNDLDIQGTAVLIPSTNDIFLGGHWTNYGTAGFTEGTSTVEFNGTLDQILDGSGGEDFYNLDINKASGDVQLNDDITVSNSLDLQNGVLDLSDHTTTVQNNAPAGITRTNGVILSDNTSNYERVYWNIQANTGNHIIPFGSANGLTYLPASFQLTSGNAGIIDVATYSTPQDNTPRPLTPVAVNNMFSGAIIDNSDATVDRFWHVGVQNTVITMNMGLSYAFGEYPIPPWNDYLILDAQRYDGSTNKWEPAAAGQVKIDLTGSYEVTVLNFAPFANTPWTFAPNIQPLPIELISFNAKVGNGYVDLEWSTASELNNDVFTVERGVDGENFQAIGYIQGAGNSNSQIDYSLRDDHPLMGLSYYRLKQTDIDGTYTYSQVEAINFNSSSTGGLSVWSDQNVLQIEHGYSGQVQIDVRDVIGRLLYSNTLEEVPSKFSLDLPSSVSKEQILILSLYQNEVAESVRFFY